jgi:ethanolamine ammonia-lyase small subunit
MITRPTDNSPAVAPEDFWSQLRASTQARIGLGRTGDAMPTHRLLDFAAAHAAARDAVHAELAVADFATAIEGVGLGTPCVVTSGATDRGVYLRRPDLGRVPADLTVVGRSAADIGVVLADGLSSRALEDHGVAMLTALRDSLSAYSFARPVIATQARVAIGDHIAAAMGVDTILVLIGERPGLSVPRSIGIYLTHLPRIGCPDSDRNCISNVHPPEGLDYRHAARVVRTLVGGARALGRSGVALKDNSREDSIVERGGPPQ